VLQEGLKLHGHFGCPFFGHILHKRLTGMGYNFQTFSRSFYHSAFTAIQSIVRVLRGKTLHAFFKHAFRARSCYCNCTHKRKWVNNMLTIVSSVDFVGEFDIYIVGSVPSHVSWNDWKVVLPLRCAESVVQWYLVTGSGLERSGANPKYDFFPFPMDRTKFDPDAEPVSSSSSVRAKPFSS
ncbi:conserved hypothetical protein, partial [Trichinella spiralis]|uniref:hypothetical protein n=1 Tax=Trichinella spiralis TaxID=6334 RepID=UPI0001EFEFD1